MKAGAFDFLTKPVNLELLRHLLKRVLERKSLVTRNEALESGVLHARGTSRFETESAAMRGILQQAGRVAITDATVLITGENGTGKEVLARHIQQLSSRADRAFVTVNCSSLSSHLLESELFGHAKGAFTGADKARKGYLEAADGGTLFLDEMAEATHEIQVKLLRFLQEKEFMRVGETEPRTSDVRVLAATNRDLQELLARGELREDFYYRLNVFRLHLPTLNKRSEDISGLFKTMVESHADRPRGPDRSQRVSMARQHSRAE